MAPPKDGPPAIPLGGQRDGRGGDVGIPPPTTLHNYAYYAYHAYHAYCAYYTHYAYYAYYAAYITHPPNSYIHPYTAAPTYIAAYTALPPHTSFNSRTNALTKGTRAKRQHACPYANPKPAHYSGINSTRA
ncbi:uncharacterized protein BDZ99DRAFT_527989 [Mytilinidion resinicola]|uniref:Uncharacterized protein n=1 Tax=Mytilinidion resinicola TaxID=574789 RepID=A0A6A6XZU3_9PEZI|nr:uncharacterized protein BDZ99DRAFT_527989 [Mytilinidion resinicola]KAF2802042.1 hypothetical protein BDZ99DRAFT_527989 [Mytilinidion resinicola]